VTYLIGLLLLVIVACAVTIYRLSGEGNYLRDLVDELQVDNHYLRERNRKLNAELLMRDIVTTTHGSSVPATLTLPAEHPQKRKPKSIRGKRK
jgi:hypothetical protein